VTRPVLLDTHVLLWMSSEPDRLSPAATQAIMEAPLAKASHASLAITCSIGRLALVPEAAGWFDAQTAAGGLAQLAIDKRHRAVQHLPLLHRDPFDRLLVAQAQIEGLDLITADARLAEYDVRIVW
jgi:PIN domain nuclease of toxin-antitoxin system